MHRKISQTMRNFIWCAKFRAVCKIGLYLVLQLLLLLISHAMRNFCIDMRNCYMLNFVPLVFFLASLIGLATYSQAWQRAMKCSKTRILHVFKLQLALPWIAQNSPSFFACFNDKKAIKNTKTSQKLINNPCQVP